jgi:Short C-terminal domain
MLKLAKTGIAMSQTIFKCVVLTMVLASCTTPAVFLKNETDGQIARCGGGTTGSMAGGLIGYNIEKSNDEECVRDFEAKGYKRMQQTNIELDTNEQVNSKTSQPKISRDVYTELTKLDVLRKKGIISEAEFEGQKKKVLNEN